MLAEVANDNCITDPVIQDLNRQQAWRLAKGFEDIKHQLQTPERSAYEAYIQNLVQRFEKSPQSLGEEIAKVQMSLLEAIPRMHGTHVAGIAMNTNPSAELLAIHSGSDFLHADFSKKCEITE